MTPEEWKKVKEVFNAVLETPESGRDRIIDIRCGEDKALVAQVRALFTSHRLATSFIESPIVGSVAALVEDPGLEPRTGQVIGAYKLEREIGRGGMGAVYLATRADDAFDKKVAVKLIKRGLDTDDIIRRFRHERQILAALEHPNLTRLLDGGSTVDGLPYLVMDYVDGAPVNEYCDREGLSLRQRLELFLHICTAVTYAHQNLVIHRDLKPSNILVTSDGVPKLLDFGIAKLKAVSGETQASIGTVDFFRAMTPDYASPEQIRGNNVTTASDVYSLGIVLYELLTGQRPFHFKNRSVEEINRILESTSPAKPSTKSRGETPEVAAENRSSFGRELQGDLDKIVLMAIRKEIDRRYSSVEQFANDIQRYLEGRPVLAQEDTVGYRATKFVKRNKGSVTAGLGIAASLVGGLIVARRQRDWARQEAIKSAKTSRFLRNMLESADPRKAAKDLKVTEMLELAAGAIDTEFARQPEIAADLNSTIGLTYLSLGQIEAAGKHLSSALQTRLDHCSRNSIALGESLHNFGKFLFAKGDLNGAEPYYADALEIFRTGDPHSLNVAAVLESLGYLIALKGEGNRAIRLHEESLAIKVDLLGERHPSVARTIVEIAGTHSVMGRHDVAEPLHRRALEIYREVYGDEHPDIALSMNVMARSMLLRRPDEAERLARESLAMRRRLLDEDHSDTAWSAYYLAYVLIERGRVSEAEPILRETLAKRGANLPDEHPVVSSCLLLLGRVHLARCSFAEALENFEACLALRSRTLEPDHWLLATTRSGIGECLVFMGETEEGLHLLRDSFELLKTHFGPAHEQTRQAEARIRGAFDYIARGDNLTSELKELSSS